MKPAQRVCKQAAVLRRRARRTEPRPGGGSMGAAALRPGVVAEGPAVAWRPEGKSGRPWGAGVRRCRRRALRAGVGRAGPRCSLLRGKLLRMLGRLPAAPVGLPRARRPAGMGASTLPLLWPRGGGGLGWRSPARAEGAAGLGLGVGRPGC